MSNFWRVADKQVNVTAEQVTRTGDYGSKRLDRAFRMVTKQRAKAADPLGFRPFGCLSVIQFSVGSESILVYLFLEVTSSRYNVQVKIKL
mmetsp:Transcript_11292/g.16362  ORF Transcript_11292/g.16362 Transcript_11292/m.16362 type:complete len:90 (-) Transcript_11292:1242-1511(-)